MLQLFFFLPAMILLELLSSPNYLFFTKNVEIGVFCVSIAFC